MGRYDSRFTGFDRDAAGDRFEYDPSGAIIDGPFAAAFNDYVRLVLDFQSDLPYEVLTGRVRPWSYDDFENRYVHSTDTLRQAMTVNPALKVFVANGYYDLATPYLATEYSFDHLQLERPLRENISMGYYEAGHMMYNDAESRMKLRDDVVKFYKEAGAKND